MPSWGYEVETTMYTMILNVTTVQPRLISKVSIILFIDVVNDRLSAICEKWLIDIKKLTSKYLSLYTYIYSYIDC